MRPEISVPEDPGAAAGIAIREALASAIAARGHARLAVPGGTGPIPVFQWLAEHLPPAIARETHLTWVDERHLPHEPHSPWQSWPEQSNRRAAWEHWLARVSQRPSELVLDAPGPLEEARDMVEERFLREMGGLVDVVLLGMGPDGHIASLFPGHPLLDSRETLLAIRDSPKPPPERISFSMPVIERAELVVLVVSGAEKGETLRRAQLGADLPISRLSPQGRYQWVLDLAAASVVDPDLAL